MTRREFMKLRPGDWVSREADGVEGEVLESGEGYASVKWDDDARPQRYDVRTRAGREESKYLHLAPRG